MEVLNKHMQRGFYSLRSDIKIQELELHLSLGQIICTSDRKYSLNVFDAKDRTFHPLLQS